MDPIRTRVIFGPPAGPTGGRPAAPVTRRAFLRRVGCAAAAALIPACGGYSLLEARWLRIYRSEVPLRGLPPAFDGLRICQLTDIHHGPYLALERVQQAVAVANGLSPHLTALTGDYVHRRPDYITPCFEALAGLRAPLGIYGVLGNHDHWEDEHLTRQEMAGAGIVELTNAGAPLQRGGQWLWIAGVGDLWEDEQLPERALQGVPADGAAILLSHNPDYNEQLQDRRVKLMLAGHTHGGQVRLPLFGPPLLPSKFGHKYAAGLVEDGWKRVYVSRGVGTVTPPVRFACRPEVTLLTLRCG